MKNREFFVFLFLFVVQLTYAQVDYTANNHVFPYAGKYRAGVNPGYYGGNWNNFDLTDLSAGNAALNIDGAGVRAIRGTLPESFGIDWGYDSWVSMYEYYDALGIKDNTLVVGVAHPTHRDPVDYCPSDPVETTMFANLYEPIWDGGANGTPVNDNNYMAKYVYDLVTTVGDHVKFWEVWNEPGFDLSGYKSGLQPGQAGNWYENDPDPCDIILRAPIQNYIRTMRITYEVIKTLSPDDYVVLSGIGTDAFLDALMRNTDNPNGGQATSEFPFTAGAYFDVVGFHSYPSIDGSTKHWDNNTQQMVYTRHSDGAVEGFDMRVEQRKDLLATYGYDGNTYPKKLLIVTEIDVPRLPFGDAFGSDELQKNYIMKSVAHAIQIDLLQTHVWQLAEREAASNAGNSFDVMGFYKNINEINPGQEQILPQGIAHATASTLLAETTYSQAETDALNLPQGVKGSAFQRADGSFIYMIWARTNTDMSEYASTTYSFPASYGNSLLARSWDFSSTNTVNTISSQNIPLTGTPVFFTRPESAGVLTLNCPAGAAIYIPAPESDGGATVTWTEPSASTTCPNGNVIITNSGGLSGSFFPFGNTVVSYSATDDCGNSKHCATRISVGSTGGINTTCHTSLWGFYFLGQRDGHKYFASADEYTYQDAVNKAASYGGQLLSIETEEENDFFLYKFGAQAYIGLSDVASEGNLTWASGAPVSYMADIETCSWCQGNTDANDYVMYHPWSKMWSFTDGTVPQIFILELDCDVFSGSTNLTINSFPQSIEETAVSGTNISWDEPTATTTCAGGIVNITQTTGPANGSYFAATGQPLMITYSFTDDCGNASTMSFTVTVTEQSTGGGNCPDNISGFTALGEFNGHKYFISESDHSWLENKDLAEANGGYLATVNNGAENDFIQNKISEMVHIGITDRMSEGNLVWENGQPVSFMNLSDCDWCGLNDAARDYGLMLFWDGKWSFDQVYTTRKMIMEVDCQAAGSTELEVVCPMDIVVSGAGGTNVSWNLPEATSTCTTGNITVVQTTGPISGSYFDADTQTVTIGYLISDDCGNSQECSFTVMVTPLAAGCPTAFPEFDFLGEYNGHKYFVSTIERTWLENRALAESNDGYLAVINDVAENDYIKNNISEMLHFGLNDILVEGNLSWVNGQFFSYSNLSDCDWCGLNDDVRDYGLIAFWDGKWSFDKSVNKRKMIMEMDCQTSDLVVSCSSNIQLEASSATMVSWDLPTGATTCVNGSISIVQTLGPVSGSYFEPNNQPVVIAYSITDECGNTEFCSFTVTVSNSNVACPTALSGYQFLGIYSGNNYFLSENRKSWQDASDLAAAVGGHLAIIANEGENEFLRTHINSYTFIGLTDENAEGQFVWKDASLLTFSKLDGSNLADDDYVMMNFWNGDWTLVNHWVEKNYVVEVECNNAQPAPMLSAKLESQSIKLFPNPAEDLINLEVIEIDEQEVTISVIDVLGKEVLRQNKQMQMGIETVEVDIHALGSGVYFVRFSTGEVIRFMKR